MRSVILLGVWASLIAYIVLGGVVFHFLERPTETDKAAEAFNGHHEFLSNFTCVSREQLETFVKGVVQAYNHGVLVAANTTTEPNWDIAGSIFFAITVVTTIGYGHISPMTSYGRTFFVFYCFVGIPLCLVALGYLGSKLQKPLNKLRQRQLCQTRPRFGQAITMLLYLLLGIVSLVFIPAIIFSVVENWSYKESLYYILVTLTTVGFGDFVPGMNEKTYRALYKMLVSVWIMIGLAWVALIINELTCFLKKVTGVKEAACTCQAGQNESNTKREINSAKGSSQEFT